MRAPKPTRFDEELGKAVADRLGLDHNSTLIDWASESLGSDVLVSMTTVKAMPLDEFNGLLRVAIERSANA